MAAPVIAGVAGGVVTDPHRPASGCAPAASWSGSAPTSTTLVARVRGTDRPWLGDAAAMWRCAQLYAGREPLYTEAATLIVDVDGATPEQTADRIIAALPGAAPTPRPNPS